MWFPINQERADRYLSLWKDVLGVFKWKSKIHNNMDDMIPFYLKGKEKDEH